MHKSLPARPRGFPQDTTLPQRLNSPDEAYKYVGRAVCKLFNAEEGKGAPTWFVGRVSAVEIEDNIPYLRVVYEDLDEEEFWWEDFTKWAVAEPAGDAGTGRGPADVSPETPLTQFLGSLKQEAGPEGTTGPLHPAGHGPATAAVAPGAGGSAPAAVHTAAVHTAATRKRGAAAPPIGDPQVGGPSGRQGIPIAHCEPLGAGDDGGAGEEHGRRAVRRRLHVEAEAEGAGAQGQAQQPNQHGPPTGQSSSAAAAAGGARAAPQRPARAPPKRRLGGDEPGPAGHLYRIQLVRFMCHENMEVFFGKHITFLSGQNGSGKSAILQGLQACLGASARETGRGSTLAGWVNDQHNSASITLELWNSTEQECGDQKWPPFRHEIYGSFIRIVRKITLGKPGHDGQPTASGTYQLYRADGSEVRREEMGQSAAKEVDALVDHFNVDASNPLMVITQDMARGFHQDTRPGPRCSKYEMYMRGTNLADIRDWLAAAKPKLERMGLNVARAHDRLRGRKEELATLEARVAELRKADELKGQLADAELAALWVVVTEAEETLELARQGAAGGPASVAALEARVEADQAALDELTREEGALREQMEATRAEDLPRRLAELHNRKQAAHRRRQRLARQLRESQAETAELEEQRQARLDELARLEAERRSEGALRRLREQQDKIDAKRAELTQLQAAASALEAQRADLAARTSAADAARASAQSTRNAANQALNQARSAHAQLAQAAAAAASGGGNAATLALQETRWGRPVMQLVNAVARAAPGTFSRPPLGPVGMYLRRSAACEERYAPALEVALRNVLNSWLVWCREDREALARMADGVRCRRPHAIVVRPSARVHNYGAEPVVDQGGRRWWRVIDLITVDEALEPTLRATLINCLLDQAGAASSVLVDDRPTAQAVAAGRLPALLARRISTAYDASGAQYEERSGTMATTPHPLPHMLVLGVDERAQQEAAVRQMEAEVARAAREVTARQAELAEAEAGLQAASEALAALQRERRELQQQQAALARDERRCHSELTALQEGLGSDTAEADSQDLLNNLRATNARLQEIAASSSGLEEQMNNAEREEQSTQEEIATLQQQSSQYVQRRQQLLDRLGQLAGRKGQATARLTARQQELAAAREEVRRTQERISRYEAGVNEARDRAAEVCSREEGLAALERARVAREAESREKHPNLPERDRAARLREAMGSKGLQRWIHATRAAIERAEAQAGGDLELVSLQAEALRREVGRAEEAVKAVSKKQAAVRDAQALREIKYRGLRDKVHKISNSKFNRYMQRRCMTARIELDHDRSRLDLKVRKNSEQQQAASLMQLSGGERSFTTTSFLLAMGEVLDTPFRAMDEYDVFTDESVRKIASMALLEYAWRANPTSQLILISPQDMTVIFEAEKEIRAKCAKEGEPAPPPDFTKIMRLSDPRAGGRQRQ